MLVTIGGFLSVVTLSRTIIGVGWYFEFSYPSKGFSGHSLRAGFATVAAINGASERDIQKTTGHTNLEVLRRYIRDADIFRNNASKKLGL